MEAVPLHLSQGQSSSPNKQFRNNKKNNRPLISRRPEDSVTPNSYGGLLHAPLPSLSFSYPPLHSRQPPLLPLPIPKPINNPRNRGLSCPPVDRKINTRTRDNSLTPKKSMPSISPKKAESKQKLISTTKAAVSSSACLTVAPTNPLGPDPKDLPQDVSRVLSSSSVNCSDLEKFSGSMVFTLSPPPSSLPLPTFSLRPKLSCNAEAAGIDAGATDNLRRLLRLR